jgi:hypothetical protein
VDLFRKKIGQPQRVLLVGGDTILDVWVETRLAGQADLQIIGALDVSDPAFHEQISYANPDVVVVTGDDWSALTQVLEELKNLDSIRIILVRFDDHKIEVFDKQSRMVANGDEFMTILRHND